MPLIECRFFLADRNDVHAVEVFAVPILDRADALPCHAPLSIDRAPPKKPWTQMELPSADPNKMVGLFQAQGFQGRQNPSYQHHGQLVPWPLLRLRTTRRFAGKRRELSLAFLKSLVPKPPNSFHPSSDGLHLHAARTARRVLNVPFQSSIRAWMLLHAARRARSLLSGECATRLSSSSLPIGP
jgi:hypothetical protein